MPLDVNDVRSGLEQIAELLGSGEHLCVQDIRDRLPHLRLNRVSAVCGQSHRAGGPIEREAEPCGESRFFGPYYRFYLRSPLTPAIA